MSNVRNKLKKAAAIVIAVSSLGATMVVETSSAHADWRNRRSNRNLGLGIVGGLAAGALIAGASRPAYGGEYYGTGYGGGYGGGGYSSGEYYEAAPAYSYEDRPVCRIERQRVYLDEYTYRTRKVRVCD